jgi:hypothetical protein
LRLAASAGIGAWFFAASAGAAVAAELTRLEIRVPLSRTDEALPVSLRCVISLDPVDSETETQTEIAIPLSVLTAFDTAIQDLTVTVDGTKLDVSLDESRRPQTRGFVRLPRVVGGKTPLSIDVEYRVPDAIEARAESGIAVRVPIVILGDPSPGNDPERFRAVVENLGDLRITESFPTGFVRSENGNGYEVELPIVPAFLTLRVQREGTLLTVPRLVDFGTLALLAGLGALGLRRLRAPTGPP